MRKQSGINLLFRFRHVWILCLVLSLLFCASGPGAQQSTEKPIDLTGADANKFRSQVGHTVILRGRLEDGKEGPCLWGATPNDVVFYVIPGYSYPKKWTRLMHQQVRLTGELKFRSFDRSKAKPYVQVPPDYFYMVLQHTKIERIEPR